MIAFVIPVFNRAIYILCDFGDDSQLKLICCEIVEIQIAASRIHLGGQLIRHYISQEFRRLN